LKSTRRTGIQYKRYHVPPAKQVTLKVRDRSGNLFKYKVVAL
jgi:hypothetical protein